MKLLHIQPLYGQNTFSSVKTVERVDNFFKNKSLDRDIISFGSKKKDVSIPKNISISHNITVNVLKHISNMPCVYCGKPMLSLKDYNMLARTTAESRGKDLIKVLNSNRKYIRRFKNNIVDDMVVYAKKYPKDDMQQLLIRMAPNYLTTLENEQLDVLKNIQKRYAKAFQSDEEKELFNLIMEETSAWIKNEDGNMPFKCKQFYYELEGILQLPIFRNRNAVKKILKAAKKMPQSSESENAFVVKYSRRAPLEISNQLYRDPLVTTEHIKPQSAGGETVMKNLVMACAYCNNTKRSSIPMDAFIKKYPKTKQYIESHFDSLLKIANTSSQRLLNIPNNRKKEILDRYVSDIAKTFMDESKNTLDFNKYIIN